jgi:NAD(P) transhydrogenase subunit alpha
MSPLVLLIIFIAATIAGYKVISDVPALLHTPLMSGMNALSGVTILGSLVATAFAVSTGNKALGFIAITLAVAAACTE